MKPLSMRARARTHAQPAIRRSKISIAILMQKRVSAVKKWIACKIDQPRVVKSLEELGRNPTRGPTVNAASFALPCPPASHFSPRRLCFLFQGPISIPTAGCPLITLYYACTRRFLAQAKYITLASRSNMLRDFSIEKLCVTLSRAWDYHFFFIIEMRIKDWIKSSIILASATPHRERRP